MKNKKRNKSTQNNFHTKQKETYFKNDKAINTNTLKNHLIVQILNIVKFHISV